MVVALKREEAAAPAFQLPKRWFKLRPHPVHDALWRSRWRPRRQWRRRSSGDRTELVYDVEHGQLRFVLVPAGRQSGKTELAIRNVAEAAIEGTENLDAMFFCAAPTYGQAKRIFWRKLKQLIPRELVSEISENELIIRLHNGSEIHVFGMDKPERIEGVSWDGGVLDEFGNMKARTWEEHVRPALAARNGWCWLIGVPEGRNHYYDLVLSAQAEVAKAREEGRPAQWGVFTWKSAEVMSPDEIEAARRDTDPLTFAQEYEASFVNFTGRAYYCFEITRHAVYPLSYNPYAPLIVCFDFNVDPGAAIICQEQLLPNGVVGTGVIGEVHIPANSNTQAVCRRIVSDFKGHVGPVVVYGDPSGGNRHPSADIGVTDWAIVKQELRRHFRRVQFKVPSADPGVRARVNAVNSRLLAGGGGVPELIRLMVDPRHCPMLVKDLDGVRLLEGGSGEIDKSDKKLTHWSDALAYYLAVEYPVSGGGRLASRVKLKVG